MTQGWKEKILLNLTAALCGFLILIPSLNAGLNTDDYRNIDTAQGISKRTIAKDLRYGSYSGSHYRPVEPLSFRVDHYVWKRFSKEIYDSSWGYHLTNILIHSLSSLLVSRIAFALTGSIQVGIGAGVLFALHPVAAASCGWVSGRTSGLVCFFLLFTTFLYLMHRKTNNYIYLILSLGMYGLALLTKEQSYLFPAFLLVLGIAYPAPSHFPGWIKGNVIRYGSVPLIAGSLYFYFQGRVEYSMALAIGGISAFVIGYIARFRPDVSVFALFLAMEALVVFTGLFPSGVLAEEPVHNISFFSVSFERLAKDIYVLLSTIGITDFTIRDTLVSFALKYPWLIVVLWLILGALLLSMLIPKNSRAKCFAGLVCFLIAIAPMRKLEIGFHDTANLYLAIPVIAITCAYLLKKVSVRAPLVALLLGLCITLFWGSGTMRAEANLKQMGLFSHDLHNIFKNESKDDPGPLRVLVNVPDPFRTVQNDPLAHFIVFRVIQSAMNLGGYSDDNVTFVEGRAVQIVAVDYGKPSTYTARILDSETLLIKKIDNPGKDDDFPGDLRFIDFTGKRGKEKGSILTTRGNRYRGYPLIRAELYGFDGKRLKKIGGIDEAGQGK